MNDPDSPDPLDPSPIEPGSERQQDKQTGWFTRLINGLTARLTTKSLRTQMEGALADDEGGDETFSAEEKAMLRNILALRELRVDDVMIPRADIDAVEDDISLGALLAIYQEVGHSRLPVYRETLDDPVGMVHIKDVVGLMTSEGCISSDGSIFECDQTEMENLKDSDDKEQEDHGTYDPLDHRSNHPKTMSNIDLQRPLSELGVIREILFVPPSMPATDLMAKMRAARTQMALVIDEYGGTDGLVSLEDVVETVVGDIEDEHDDEEQLAIAAAGPNLFIADAKADLEEVSEVIGFKLVSDEEFDDVDTLGGLIFTHIGRIPVRGELIAISDGLEIEVMDADPRRIKRVKIRFKPIKKAVKRLGSTNAAPSEPSDPLTQDTVLDNEQRDAKQA
ncbi:MAG: hemolysin family protein [Cohaesibacter sp.]|nr:hemolysin family protein [Cohaesibacter sp.]